VKPGIDAIDDKVAICAESLSMANSHHINRVNTSTCVYRIAVTWVELTVNGIDADGKCD